MKDYRLGSGERQVGTTMSHIRADHTARYQMVVDTINSEYQNVLRTPSDVSGLDAFCGNGYGTYMLADQANCVVHGIDASRDGIMLADRNFATPSTFFSVKEFPFEVPFEAYDFVVSMESIEHVEDSYELIHTLACAVKPGGYLFLSTPNSNVLSLELIPNKFHFRHFTYTELNEHVERTGMGMELIEYFGQDCYILNSNGTLNGNIDVTKMNLRPNYMDGQFHCFIFRKPN